MNNFSEVNYRPLIEGIDNEIDKLSRHLEENLSPEMNYGQVQSVIESFQIEPEQFLGRIGRAATSFAKKAVKGIKNVAKKIAAPALKLALKPIINFFKTHIKKIIENVLKRRIRTLT